MKWNGSPSGRHNLDLEVPFYTALISQSAFASKWTAWRKNYKGREGSGKRKLLQACLRLQIQIRASTPLPSPLPPHIPIPAWVYTVNSQISGWRIKNNLVICAKTLHAQSCPALCDPVDCSPSGASVHGISQARMLGWVASSFSRVFTWPRDWICVSCVSYIVRWILYHYCHLGSYV